MLLTCPHATKSSAETLAKIVHRLLLPAVVVDMLMLLVLIVFVAGASATHPDENFLLDTISTLDERIIGGHEAKLAQFPYHAILRNRRTSYCGGSIIAERFILTAAQCTQGPLSDPSNVDALVGESFWLGFKVYLFDRITNHPKYIERKLDHDISVLRTKRVMRLSPSLQLIPLPTVDVPPEGNVPVTVSGWGQYRVSHRVFAFTRFHLHSFYNPFDSNTI